MALSVLIFCTIFYINCNHHKRLCAFVLDAFTVLGLEIKKKKKNYFFYRFHSVCVCVCRHHSISRAMLNGVLQMIIISFVSILNAISKDLFSAISTFKFSLYCCNSKTTSILTRYLNRYSQKRNST